MEEFIAMVIGIKSYLVGGVTGGQGSSDDFSAGSLVKESLLGRGHSWSGPQLTPSGGYLGGIWGLRSYPPSAGGAPCASLRLVCAQSLRLGHSGAARAPASACQATDRYVLRCPWGGFLPSAPQP